MDIRTERLLEAFRNSGMSQTELCNKTGINKGAMSSYLSGRYFPKQQALEKLASALHVSIFYLMGFEDNSSSSPAAPDPAEEHLLSVYRDLNNDGRNKLLGYADDLQASGRYKKYDSVSDSVV